MSSTTFDYAIVGAGNAGLQLAMAMMQQPMMQGKSVIILEKDDKTKDDKTWCYWEKGTGKWDHLLTKSWPEGLFVSPANQQPLALAPYTYKMLRARDFNDYCQKAINEHPDFYWESGEISDITKEGNGFILHCTSGATWKAGKVFDSRLPQAFHDDKDKYLRLLQHFRGWEIETSEDAFDPEVFTMMDFRVKWQNSTSFTYVLPLSPRKALVEFTLFTPDLIEDAAYNQCLEKYIDTILKIKNYKITRVEEGIIPMTTYPFHKLVNIEGITPIGTAASWVKPSTGYSFKNTERLVDQLIANIVRGIDPSKGLIGRRPRFMDSILLDILVKRNEIGERLFEEMYQNNSIHDIFKFLDERTSFLEDVRIAASFSPRPFLKALSNHFFSN